jgi:hypothetical protein
MHVIAWHVQKNALTYKLKTQPRFCPVSFSLSMIRMKKLIRGRGTHSVRNIGPCSQFHIVTETKLVQLFLGTLSRSETVFTTINFLCNLRIAPKVALLHNMWLDKLAKD